MTASDTDFEAVLRDLRSPEWAVRVQATRKLPAFTNERAFDALVAALYDPENTAVTEAAAEELLRLSSPDAVDALLAALVSDDREVANHVRDILETSSSPVSDEILWCHDAHDRR